MILSATANVTLGENKTKNKQNNLFHASSWRNMVDRRREAAKTSGKSYTCSTGSESVKVEADWGVEGVSDRVKGAWVWNWGGATDMHADIDTHTYINWPLLVERGAGSVNSDPWGSGLCHLAVEGGRPISVMALCCGFLLAEVSGDGWGQIGASCLYCH